MRTIIAPILLALTLVGCGTSASSEAEGTDWPDTSNDPTFDTDEAFVSVVRDSTEIFDTSPDDDIVQLGRTVCEVFEVGAGFYDVVDTMDSPDPTQAAFVVGASIAAYCPQYEDKIPS